MLANAVPTGFWKLPRSCAEMVASTAGSAPAVMETSAEMSKLVFRITSDTVPGLVLELAAVPTLAVWLKVATGIDDASAV
jgi:hypothetical protein